jgi:hypothetical protein
LARLASSLIGSLLISSMFIDLFPYNHFFDCNKKNPPDGEQTRRIYTIPFYQ